MLVSQNNEMAAMLVFQTSPVGLMQTLYFVPINLHKSWPCEAKHFIAYFQSGQYGVIKLSA